MFIVPGQSSLLLYRLYYGHIERGLEIRVIIIALFKMRSCEEVLGTSVYFCCIKITVHKTYMATHLVNYIVACMVIDTKL